MKDGKIIYFGGTYYPQQKTLLKLEALQSHYRETTISILIDCKYDKYNYTLRKQALANRIRDKWKVIDGEMSVSPDSLLLLNKPSP